MKATFDMEFCGNTVKAELTIVKADESVGILTNTFQDLVVTDSFGNDITTVVDEDCFGAQSFYDDLFELINDY